MALPCRWPPWKLLTTSLCRWALEWSPIASIQLAARAVRRAGAKNIEGGEVTRGDVSSGCGHWEEVETTLAFSHADIIRLGRS